MAKNNIQLYFFLFATIALESSLVWGSLVAPPSCGPIVASDKDRIRFALNLEFLEAEFFLRGALGIGLDSINSSLAHGGPPPIGARKARLTPQVSRIIEEFAYQEVGHLRAIVDRVGGFARPLLNLSAASSAMDKAVGYTLRPPFDPYANTVNFLLASYMIPYVGLVGYVGTIPALKLPKSRSLVASLLGVESGQDAVIRALLYQRANQVVVPYGITVAKFTNLISTLRNNLGKCGMKDEGVTVPLKLGAENRTTSNILSADPFSLSYARNPQEILRTVYGTGLESRPGGIFPNGANGKIARKFLPRPA